MKPAKQISHRLTYIEFLIATRDEVDVEAELISLKGRDDRSDFFLDAKKALHEIAALKLTGSYQAERERLAEIYSEDSKAAEAEMRRRNPHLHDFENYEPDPVFRERFENLMKGLDSPDQEQRSRFRQFWEATELADKLPQDALPFIGALETAKGKRGRPASNPPWREIAWALDEMRLLVTSGLSVPQAAKAVAENERRANEISRAEYFESGYRKREDLRK